MNILVISSNLIGDTILSTGIVKYFLDKYPHSKFTFVVGPSSGQLYENFPNLEKIITIKKQKFNFHWFLIWKKCFFQKWNIIIDFRSSLVSYILFNQKKFIFKPSNDKHQLKQLSDSFNINLIPYPFIFNNIQEIKTAKKILDPNIKIIVIAPGGNWIPKIWPTERFNQLLKLLCEKYSNLNIILVGSFFEKKNILMML